MREWIEDLHPRYIAVTKKELIRQLSLHGGGELILRTLAAGTAHPHFEERLTKACYRLQLLSSFVYLVHNKNGESCFRRRTAKLPVARYEALIFDGFCENPSECRERLARMYQEGGWSTDNLSDAFVHRTFKKYCAVKRYTLPMLANTLEYAYFSFYRHILLYVTKHETYPEFPISPSYKYPLMPGMCECDVDVEY